MRVISLKYFILFSIDQEVPVLVIAELIGFTSCDIIKWH